MTRPSAAVLTSRPARRYRVVQWATGNVGLRSLRALIEHPAMQLVGLYVYSQDKAGRDAGELCGLPAIGVSATRSLDDIVALKADCVVYMPQAINVDELCRLLEAGSNVVTSRPEFALPSRLAPDVRERIEAACRAGDSSIHSTGSSPGFITEMMPLTLLSLQRRLDGLHINEYADCSSRDSPEMLFRIMGFGQAPNPQAEAGRVHYLREEFGPALRVVADAVGLDFDSVEARGQVALARSDIPIAAGVVKAGTVAALRTTVSGMRNGKPLMTFTANWFIGYDIDADWKLRGDGWQVEIEGDCPLDMHLYFTVPLERKAATTPGYTAHPVVNSVAYVCEAAPGIRTSAQLPRIIPDFGGAA